jgi:hypothetical protein
MKFELEVTNSLVSLESTGAVGVSQQFVVQECHHSPNLCYLNWSIVWPEQWLVFRRDHWNSELVGGTFEKGSLIILMISLIYIYVENWTLIAQFIVIHFLYLINQMVILPIACVCCISAMSQ